MFFAQNKLYISTFKTQFETTEMNDFNKYDNNFAHITHKNAIIVYKNFIWQYIMYLGSSLLKLFVTFFHLSVVIFLLLRNSGNIHLNPGPQNLNVCHANVRSMRAQSKLDEIKNMATVILLM